MLLAGDVLVSVVSRLVLLLMLLLVLVVLVMLLNQLLSPFGGVQSGARHVFCVGA